MKEVSPTIEAVPGFHSAGVACGLKANGARDFALFVSDADCATGAVFTKNHVKAACVLVDMEHIATHADRIRAVAINTKSANACTGQKGIDDAKQTADLVAGLVGCQPQQVLVLSTGVIGLPLNMQKIGDGVKGAHTALGDCWPDAADAMRTTDTRPKMACTTVALSSGETVTVAGVAKGSGMIAPNMATMLSVIVTDAKLSSDDAQAVLDVATESTFNRIVVDGDMSTNDTVFLLANGASGASINAPEDFHAFQEAVTAVSRKLAQDIVRDGEGATKLITLHVTGTETDHDARAIATAIATSPLVKTAYFGNDANWGRIIAAAGRAGVPFDPNRALLWVESAAGKLTLFSEGVPEPFDEGEATAVMSESEIETVLHCGDGNSTCTLWTCDLSHEYVSINGDYRT